MKEIINEQEVKKFNYYGNIFSIHFLILIISAPPLFFWLERYAFIPFGVLFAITMFWALKVEKIKKENDIQTYKEIVAFTEGKKLDELHKAVEKGKRPYDIPLWCKPNLSIEEAAAYSGIGMGKLYEMTESQDCPFVLWIGSRRMIKRKVFDEFIERQYSI